MKSPQPDLFTGQVTLDESLMRRRRVRQCVDDDQGLGFDVQFQDCGHWVWMAVRANATEYCGLCLDKLVRQVRDARDRQQSSLKG